MNAMPRNCLPDGLPKLAMSEGLPTPSGPVTPTLGAPTGLTATDAGGGNLNLSWTPVMNATDYTVEWHAASDCSDPPFASTSDTGGSSAWNATMPTPDGSDIYARVMATAATGFNPSPWSRIIGYRLAGPPRLTAALQPWDEGNGTFNFDFFIDGTDVLGSNVSSSDLPTAATTIAGDIVGASASVSASTQDSVTVVVTGGSLLAGSAHSIRFTAGISSQDTSFYDSGTISGTDFTPL